LSLYRQRCKISHGIFLRNVGIRLQDYTASPQPSIPAVKIAELVTVSCTFVQTVSANMPSKFAISCLLNLQCWHAATLDTASACAGKTARVASARHNITSRAYFAGSGPTLRARPKWLTYAAALTFLLSIRVPKSLYDVIPHHFPSNISGLDWLLYYDSCFKSQLPSSTMSFSGVRDPQTATSSSDVLWLVGKTAPVLKHHVLKHRGAQLRTELDENDWTASQTGHFTPGTLSI
jgi:hypothetical protein